MLETPELHQAAAQPAAVIHLTIPRAEIRQVMGPGYQELMAAVAGQNAGPAGPWFSHHLRLDPEVFDFEIGIPVTRPISPTGRVRAGELPARRVVRAVYRGGYEGLGQGWGELEQWIKGQRLATAPDFWERYLAGPETGPDSSGYRTELNHPLA